MSLIRPARVIVYAFLGILALCAGARAQVAPVAIDTMQLAILPPESLYTRYEAGNIIVGWYPPDASVGSVTGSRDFTNWYANEPAGVVSHVDVVGIYSGTVDRVLNVGRLVTGSTITRDQVGITPSIKMLAEIHETKQTYFKEFNLGSSYTPGDTIPLVLVGRTKGDTLKTGVGLVFHAGIVDTAFGNQPANFEVDLQTYEGFHIWRGLSPLPSHMMVITELSRDDAYLGVKSDSAYYANWPKRDRLGRPYYEYVDDNTFVGFTYYYVVTCYDKGYFKGKFLFNKKDNFICDEDLQHPQDPEHPIKCQDVASMITKAVRTGTDMKKIFAVPNPYRTGTSAESTPFYHNFPDGSIKFFNVPKECDLKIFTVAGDLVWETHHSSSTGDSGVVTWDVKNKKGQEVGSGVYIYRVKNSAGGDMYGRIVVIR